MSGEREQERKRKMPSNRENIGAFVDDHTVQNRTDPCEPAWEGGFQLEGNKGTLKLSCWWDWGSLSLAMFQPREHAAPGQSPQIPSICGEEGIEIRGWSFPSQFWGATGSVRPSSSGPRAQRAIFSPTVNVPEPWTGPHGEPVGPRQHN